MKNSKISLCLFMLLGLLSYILLVLLQAMRFAPPAPFLQALSSFDILWFLGGTVFMYFPYFQTMEWILSHRTLLLLGSIAWPLLDGLFVLNTMAAYRNVAWHMDLLVLCSLVLMSVFGIIASLQCDQCKERETAFLFSLFIGIFAIWEYWSFNNFGYASFFFTGVIVLKLLNSNRSTEG